VETGWVSHAALRGWADAGDGVGELRAVRDQQLWLGPVASNVNCAG
jgi:hypothetical protein